MMTNSERTRTGITMKIPPFRRQITGPPLLVSLVFLPCLSRSSRVSSPLGLNNEKLRSVRNRQCWIQFLPPILRLFLTVRRIILFILFIKLYMYYFFFLQYCRSTLIFVIKIYFSICRKTIKIKSVNGEWYLLPKGYFSSFNTIRKTC